MTTKLEAINACLAGIGNEPVAIETEDLDAAMASETIDRISNKLQAAGWFFNKEYNWKRIPDSITGYIDVAPSVLSMVPSGPDRDKDLQVRGKLIYDMYNHTNNLTDRPTEKDGTITFIVITRLAFEELPETARIAITYSARREFAQDLEVDERRWKFQKTDELDAHAALEKEDARASKTNSIRDNSVIQSFLVNVGGPNSYQGRVGVFPARNA